MKNFVISITPLTSNYKREILDSIGLEFDFITLSELKKLGVIGAFRFLFRKRADLWVIAVEDMESGTVLPILRITSLLVSAKKKYAIDSNLKLIKLSTIKNFLSAPQLGMYTLYNLIYKEIGRFKLLQL